MYILISSIKISEDRIPVFVVGGSIVLTYDIEGVDFRCSRDLQDRAGYHVRIFLNEEGAAQG
jgi:hypothetical protein